MKKHAYSKQRKLLATALWCEGLSKLGTNTNEMAVHGKKIKKKQQTTKKSE